MSRGSSKMGIQSVYDLCKKTFKPSVIVPPSSQVLQNLCSLLDSLTPADVGLKEENIGDDRGYGLSSLNPFNRISRWAQPITYVDVVQDNNFTMCIFCFPTSSVIPLHDHPSMTVFSKILYGSLHVKAYDWVDPPNIITVNGPSSFHVRLAKLSVDKLLTPSSGTAVLFPRSGGNLHCFTAITPCAVLDVLTPPYEESLGRKCTYYHDYPYSTLSKGQPVPGDGKEEDYAWLAEINTPDDLYMVTGIYSVMISQQQSFADDDAETFKLTQTAEVGIHVVK
ncbi:hypothetical protein V2J09_019431 [Rumex salicifolius]